MEKLHDFLLFWRLKIILIAAWIIRYNAAVKGSGIDFAADTVFTQKCEAL